MQKQWSKSKLGDICDINPSKRKQPDSTPVSFIPMRYIDEITGQIVTRDQVSYKKVAKGYTSFIENDVLFAKITPCMENGKCAIAKNLTNGIGFGSTEFHILRSKKYISPDWIWLFLRQEKIRNEAKRHFTGAVGHKRVPEEFIRDLEVALPIHNNEISYGEQKRIADKIEKLFGEVDKAIEKTSKAVQQVDGLFLSIATEIFSSISQVTQPIKLGDNKFFKIETGSTPKTNNSGYWSGGSIVWVTPKDLGKLNDIYINDSGRKITESGYKSCSTTLIPVGSIVISTRAPIGYVAIASHELCFNQGCKAIVFSSPKVDSKYVYYATLMAVDKMRELGKGATFSEISKQKLEGVEILLPFSGGEPDILSQRRIATKLDKARLSARLLLEKYQKQLAMFGTLKQSLLNQAFQGKL